jgi:hypothetical protein
VDRLPDHRVDFIVLAWKFRDGEMAVLFLISLGPRAAREEPGANSMRSSSSVSFSSIAYSAAESSFGSSISGDALDAGFLPQRGSPSFSAKRSATAGLVVHQQQKSISGACAAPALALRALRSMRRRRRPSGRARVADGADMGVCRRVKRAGTNLQGWLRESRGIFQPCLVVSSGAFLVLAYGP